MLESEINDSKSQSSTLSSSSDIESPYDVVNMFNEMDVDKNGLVNYTEFVSALMDYRKMIKKEQLLECFKSYDTDGSGKISFDEFCDMIKPQNEKEKKELQELYNKFDDNGDGEIDFDEFVNGFNKM